ncbi:MAG: DUF4038 domain-containing protein [Kiritimatiellae bacterium]|nr:DUF4038 domain-containing protein [Kiritimatiellia bacterium]
MSDQAQVERFGIFEQTLEAAGSFANPYAEIRADATLTRPDGSAWKIPLFWDGARRWKLRVSPDTIGDWSVEIRSSDTGLHGTRRAFRCNPSSLHGGIMPMPGYPYHFQHQDGTPFWFFGDTGWRCFADNAEKALNRESVCHYFDVRAGQGFNYVHVDIMGGGGIPGEQPVFTDMDAERINPDFFNEVDHRLRYMNGKGLTCGLVFGWQRGNPAWEAFSNDEARLRYARYLVARYSAFNVVLIVAGEWDQCGIDKKPRCQAIGREVMQWDPHGRMRAIHPCGKSTVEEFAFEPWMSFGDYQQMYEAPNGEEATPQQRDALRRALLTTRRHNKPVVNSEYAYYLRHMGGDHSYFSRQPLPGVDKPHSHTRDSFRRASWVLAMAGGYFVSGFGSTYFGGWRDLDVFSVDDPRYDEAEQDLVRIRQFFSAFEWWKLEPADCLVWGMRKAREKAESNGAFAYCLADIGRTYVVYAEGHQSVSLDLGGAPAGTWTVSRFDPRSGAREELEAHEGIGPVSLTAPSREDWVFLVKQSA